MSSKTSKERARQLAKWYIEVRYPDFSVGSPREAIENEKRREYSFPLFYAPLGVRIPTKLYVHVSYGGEVNPPAERAIENVRVSYAISIDPRIRRPFKLKIETATPLALHSFLRDSILTFIEEKYRDVSFPKVPLNCYNLIRIEYRKLVPLFTKCGDFILRQAKVYDTYEAMKMEYRIEGLGFKDRAVIASMAQAYTCFNNVPVTEEVTLKVLRTFKCIIVRIYAPLIDFVKLQTDIPEPEQLELDEVKFLETEHEFLDLRHSDLFIGKKIQVRVIAQIVGLTYVLYVTKPFRE